MNDMREQVTKLPTRRAGGKQFSLVPCGRRRIDCFAAALLLMAASPFSCYGVAHAEILQNGQVQSFIDGMVDKHGYSRETLEFLFSRTQVSPNVLQAVKSPAEKLDWGKYRKIFVTSQRIAGGIAFRRKYADPLEKAYVQYGVPPQMIASIIGVETFYGRNKGKHNVLSALCTLAFYSDGRREDFFRSELEHFLLLVQEQDIPPLSVYGSYAGAMGIPQFISSSYRNYAVDFNGDGKADIWEDYEDAIGSVANYMSRHGWVSGDVVAHRIDGTDQSTALLDTLLGPQVPVSALLSAGASIPSEIGSERYVRLFRLENGKENEYWAGFNNFEVIRRYNISNLYAMVVYQLGLEIEQFEGVRSGVTR